MHDIAPFRALLFYQHTDAARMLRGYTRKSTEHNLDLAFTCTVKQKPPASRGRPPPNVEPVPEQMGEATDPEGPRQ
jgi:hypothetical protein